MEYLGKTNNDFKEIIKKARVIIEFDVARISKTMGRMSLIIGFKKNTKNDVGQWIKNGEPINFDYVDEKIIASGDTEEELIESVREYKRPCNMSWEE